MAYFLDNFTTYIYNTSVIDCLNVTEEENQEIVGKARFPLPPSPSFSFCNHRESAEFMMEVLTATDILLQDAKGKGNMPNASLGLQTKKISSSAPRLPRDPEARWKGKWRNPSPPPAMHPGTPSFKYPPSASTPSFGGRFASDAAQFESWRSTTINSQPAPPFRQPSNLHLVALAQRLGIQ
eukprot:553491-Hanusia_phi.AAC.3